MFLRSATGRCNARLVPVDSASLVRFADAGHVIVTGSQGALFGHERLITLLSGGRGAVRPDPVHAGSDASDLTGTPVYRPRDGSFKFVRGPVFSNLVLVDEINRAPPKVQSALLEAMAERQVTAGNQTHPLPDRDTERRILELAAPHAPPATAGFRRFRLDPTGPGRLDRNPDPQ